MKKIIICFLSVCILLTICSCNDSRTENDETINDESVMSEVKSLLADGATLSTVRPSENELSEEEIALKLANTVAELGYYNTEFADEIDPKLKYCKVESPEYVYTTNPNSTGNGGYLISAVDDEGFLVATVTCNAEADRDMNNFIGSYGPCTGVDMHSITKREVCEILDENLPDKEYTEPALVSVKMGGIPFYDVYWYVAAVSEDMGNASKALAESSDVIVEEYLIDSAIMKYVPSKDSISKSLQSSNPDGHNIWEGIMKVDGSLGFYKVIEANKTIIDPESKQAKALNTGSNYSDYRGKELSTLHTGPIKVTKI